MRGGGVEAPVAIETARERLALEVFHGDVGRAVPRAVIEHVHDVRAAKLRLDLRLALEASDHLRLTAPFALDELDCARNAEAEVAREPHRSHAPFADLPHEPKPIGDRDPFTEAGR